MIDQNSLLDQLENLLPSQLRKLSFRLGVDEAHLPLNATPADYGMALIRLYQQQKKDLQDLQNEVYKITRPSLAPCSQFKHEILNPYATYAEGAEGSVVEDEQMFFGRNQLLTELLTMIQNTASTRNIVIYGQRKIGKSTVLHHLKCQLQFPFIPVDFSIFEIIEDFSLAAFLNRIIQRIQDKCQELAVRGYPRLSLSFPRFAELKKSPQPKFQDYITQLHQSLQSENIYRQVRFILLIDEFSYIYAEIKRGRVEDTFMKFWKALQEQGNFGSVLVGDDAMDKFVDQFPNEFQITRQRLSYFDADEARQLIIEPIRFSETGESRYQGNTVDRLIELTAGSPFYIQVFCNRLVNYMNQKSIAYVTDLDIEQVRQDLTQGQASLHPIYFDHLISHADFDAGDRNDSEAVLRAIAYSSGTQGYCERRSIDVATTSASVDRILDDLCKREVLEKRGNSQFRIRVQLFKDWLLVN